MNKRLFANVIIAYILFPSIICLKNFYQIEILHDKTVFSGTFLDYTKGSLSMLFFLMPTLFALFILLPYNLVVLNWNRKTGLNMFKKILIFETVLVLVWCLFGTFSNVWMYPYWKNLLYIAYFIPPSILFASLIHFWIDKNT